MLKKKALNRILVTTVAVFIVFVASSFNFMESKNIYGFNTYKTNYKESIYTLNKDDYVSKTYIYVDKELTTLEKIKLLMETMIINNDRNTLLPSYFKPILPRNTKIISVLLDNKIIKINFSKELLDITKEQSEQMIEAIVYTLTNIDEVNGIEIYVENQLLKFVPYTTKSLKTVLTKDFGINKKYEITSNKDISKVVLYFLGSNNDYIPITKYVNDNREKVEIIIESLANYNYYDNLISLIGSKVELKNYKFKDNTCFLTFNEKLNNDVVDMISYAIFNNYDVDNIAFIKDNLIFTTKSKKNIE